MDVRHCYAAGCVLGFVGSLAAVAGMVLAGSVAIAVIALGTPVVFVLALRNVFTNERFDRDHSLVYRVVNWGGALFVVALGLLMLAVGVVSLSAFS